MMEDNECPQCRMNRCYAICGERSPKRRFVKKIMTLATQSTGRDSLSIFHRHLGFDFNQYFP